MLHKIIKNLHSKWALLIALSLAYVGSLLTLFIISALDSGLAVDSYAANGTFQIYNPLKRIAEGQIIAKDFPFFHGVGVVLLHFPLFQILGENLFAAEVSKQLVSPIIFLISTFLFFLAFFKRFSTSFVATALFTVFSTFALYYIFSPANSLLGIRSTIPVLIGAFILWSPTWKLSFKKIQVPIYHPTIAVLLALSFALGTEQGLASIIAYVLLTIFLYKQSNLDVKSSVLKLACIILSIAAAVYITLAILTLGNVNDALRYALLDIPRDQGWYFGAPPNTFLEFDTLIPMLFSEFTLTRLWPIIITSVLITYVAFLKNILSRTNLIGISFLILYGLIVFGLSATGYWNPETQLSPLARVCGLISLALLIKIFFTILHGSKNYSLIKFRILLVNSIMVLASGVLIISTYNTLVTTANYDVKKLLQASTLGDVRSDYSTLSLGWKNEVKPFLNIIGDNSSVWFTYRSIYDINSTQYRGPNSGEDYIIHALGPERRDQYSKDFQNSNPEFVVTMKPTYFIYEEWLWSRHWSFYRHLIENYDIVTENYAHILWRRSPAPSNTSTAPEQITQKRDSYRISLPGNKKIRLYEVTVRMKPAHDYIFSDKVSRQLISIDGSSIQSAPISLPPYENDWKFPVALAPGDEMIKLRYYADGIIPKRIFDIESVAYEEIILRGDVGFMFYNLSCFPLDTYKLYVSFNDGDRQECGNSKGSIEQYRKLDNW